MPFALAFLRGDAILLFAVKIPVSLDSLGFSCCIYRDAYFFNYFARLNGEFSFSCGCKGLTALVGESLIGLEKERAFWLFIWF